MSTPRRSRATLLKPPPRLPNVSPIETILQLHPLTDISPTIYTNAYPLWHPPSARGIFGGAAVAQSLSAAQATVPTGFVVHSMHCSFLLAGDSEIPVVYEVERVRDGKSFLTRAVQARQRGSCIFTTTISFMRERSGGEVTVEHQTPIPADVEPPPERSGESGLGELSNRGDDGSTMPFEVVVCRSFEGSGGQSKPEEKRTRQWIRARGRISDGPVGSVDGTQNQNRTTAAPPAQKADNHQAHLSALAYMSDSSFIGTVARVHNLRPISARPRVETTSKNLHGSKQEKGAVRAQQPPLKMTGREEEEENAAAAAAAAAPPTGSRTGREPPRQIGMMVTLDHSIFFHNPRKFRADEWMLREMSSPWAGQGRGLVLQRIWTKDGVLIATCTQEGVVRLKQDREHKL